MRQLRHLARRFFGSIRARRPGPEAQQQVAGWLRAEETSAFWAQPVPDQAHAVSSAQHVERVAPDRLDLIRAALLHDVGKRHSRLGTMGRSIATALRAMRVRRTARMRSYLEHGDLGADELAGLGAEAIVVAFARHHHGSRPDAIAPDDWELLLEADDE